MPKDIVRDKQHRKINRKSERTRRIVWALIALVAIVLIVLKIMEIDFNFVKKSISGKSDKSIVSNLTEDAFPFALDSSKNVRIASQNDKLNILTDVSCTVLNPADGSIEYTFNHGYSCPIISTAGNYMCIIDQGSNRYRLDNLTEKVYESNTDFPILNADVSKNGTVILAYDDDKCKSRIIVDTKGLGRLLDLSVNNGYVTDVAVDSSGKRYAYASVSTENAKILTTVYTVNAGAKEEIASFKFTGSNILDLHYCGSDLYVVANDCVSLISSQKKQKEVFKKGEVNTTCFGYTDGEELVYVYSKYSSANENYLTYINSNGKVKTSTELNQRPEFVSSSEKEMTVLFTDKIVSYSLNRGEELASAPCDDSVNKVFKLSSKCFICRHQVIDVTELNLKEDK